MQVLADFVMEFSILEEESEEDDSAEKVPGNQWVMHVDGSSNTNVSGARLILTNLEGDVIQYALRFGFPSTNSEAEYKVLITGLRISKELGVQHLKACSDSQLVVSHVLDEYEAREENMKIYFQKLKDLIRAFHSFDI